MTVTSTVELDELVPVLEVGLDFSVCPVDLYGIEKHVLKRTMVPLAFVHGKRGCE